MLDGRIYQDEKYGFWEKPLHRQECYNPYGGYGNCGGYGYPGPGFLVNGYPPYQVPVTTFNKSTTYTPTGTVVTENETV